MLRGRREAEGTDAARVDTARGGVTGGSVLTGVVVAFGAMFLLTALVGGVLAALGLLDDQVTTGDAIDAGIGAGIAFAVAQFLAYYWGGYTAGRMARGAGLANGISVPLVAILLGLAVAGVVTLLGTQANLNLPLSEARLPLEEDTVVNWGVGIGIAALVLMFLGGALGGIAGARWHNKLERNVREESLARAQEDDHGGHDHDHAGHDHDHAGHDHDHDHARNDHDQHDHDHDQGAEGKGSLFGRNRGSETQEAPTGGTSTADRGQVTPHTREDIPPPPPERGGRA